MTTGWTPAETMRVLHIASGDLWAGAEVQICTLLSNLAHNHRLLLRAVTLNDGELAQRLHQVGIAVTVLNERQLSSVSIIKRMRSIMREFRPHVVHTHRRKENVLGTLANLSTVRARMVRTQHGAEEHRARWSQPARRLNAVLDTWSARVVPTAVIAVAPHLQARLARRFGTARVVVIENGIDADAIIHTQCPAPFRAAAPQAMHIGFIGRLEPVKRVDLVLDVASALCGRAEGVEWQFHLYGDGSLRRSLERHRDVLGLTASVHFHGHDAAVTRYLNGFDALLLTSDHEGLPMTVLEARAVGVPIAAHAVGGIPVALRNYDRAVLIPNQNPDEYAGALRRLAVRYAKLRPLPPLPRAGDPFDAAVNAERTFALYASMLRRR